MYDYIYMKCLEQENSRRVRKQINGCLGLEGLEKSGVTRFLIPVIDVGILEEEG